MITFTYAQVDGYQPRHLSETVDHMRKWLLRHSGRPMRYTWTGELQERGALHYHMLIWLPKGVTMRKPDKAGWWKHGQTRCEWVRKSAAGYISKYITKPDAARFPQGCRTHGNGGLTLEMRHTIRRRLLPSWVVSKFPDPGDDVRRAPGGGWVNRDTGEQVPSPFKVFLKGGAVWLVPNNSTEGR